MSINRQLFTEREKAFAASSKAMRWYWLVLFLILSATATHYLAFKIGAWITPKEVTILHPRIVAPTPETLALRNESCLEVLLACKARKRSSATKENK